MSGRQQRVAIVWSPTMNPDLVLADEPTGNQDTKSADGVFELMRRVNHESGTWFLMATLKLHLARYLDRIVDVLDGRIMAPEQGDTAPAQSARATPDASPAASA
jgi:lipoprotein-releasing system ATP-binding protein